MDERVCCLGSINVDVTLLLERMPERHEKIFSRAACVSGGGSAANTAVWLARRGASVRMLGWVGDDLLGAFALRDLSENGVDARAVKALAAPSPVAVCLAPPGDKRIVTSPIIDAPWTPLDALPDCAGANWLHTTVVDLDFLARARETVEIVSLELDGRYDPAFARLADYLFTNGDELSRAIGCDDAVAEIARRHGADRAVWFVTRGEDGVDVVCGGAVTRVAAQAFEPLDRTGGGDAFDAGAIDALREGATPEAAARAGLALAAEAMQRIGAR